MISVELSESAVEVLEILKRTKESDVLKIPNSFMEFLKENRSKTYEPQLDYTKPISEMNLKPKTQALLGVIYLKYWADDEGKKEFQKRISENEKKVQEELQEKYSIDKLFKREEKAQDSIEFSLVVKEESFIKKVINKIKNIFKTK